MGRLLSRLGLKKKSVGRNDEEAGNPTFFKGNKFVNRFRWICYVLSELLLIGTVIYAIFCFRKPGDRAEMIVVSVIIYFLVYFPFTQSGMTCANIFSNQNYPKGIVYLMYFNCIVIDGFIFLLSFEKAPLVLVAGPFLLLLRFFALIFPSYFVLYDYTPYNDRLDSRYRQVSAYEERKTEEKNLCVKESGPFRIMIENEGEEEVKSFKIYRSVHYENEIGLYYLNYKVKLQNALQKGESVVLIPQSHNEPAAVKIPSYRSFGPYRGHTIKTTVCVPKTKTQSTFIEKFELPGRKKEEPKEVKFIEHREF